MPLCKIRTSRLTFREIYRICGPYGFPLVALMKVVGRDFPAPDRYLSPCFWSDMQVSPESLSAEVHNRLRTIQAALPTDESPWACHFFQRPHQAAVIQDSGGAFFFAPGSRLHLMHACVKAANGKMVGYTYVASFRKNGHTIATTNNGKGFDSVPGSECHTAHEPPQNLITSHRDRISSVGDLQTLATFQEFTVAYDRKERIQSDWDLARGAYAPASQV
jgi:hypothetical protein